MGDGNRAEEQIRDWYERYSSEIFRYIFVAIGDRQQARDLMQETFIKAFKSIDSYRGDASPRTWLHRIARNETIDYQRKKRPLTYVLENFAPIKSNRPTPQEIIELGEEMGQLYENLTELKKEYREVIILRKVKEFSTRETASILGWKESKVKTVLHRGIEELRKRMGKEESEYGTFKQSN
ncbi:RNA polymerase sigma-70 factor (ECF subfamily) [Bacillus tianshenii]|uniref:RNA polymerase sigma-70 factor (ECF subfamily) n=1 Tax=Sutcliffiella tianshenii TaxID=1463404 RepID=A0ABS2NVA0_9BACI|nr:RNA polymerase sigma factor [Bacillus tianshenii]MBM7618532.1 RNA polymerase sigma-70 factor (ECF subfamily) [Bacillus tianshenii]